MQSRDEGNKCPFQNLSDTRSQAVPTGGIRLGPWGETSRPSWTQRRSLNLQSGGLCSHPSFALPWLGCLTLGASLSSWGKLECGRLPAWSRGLRWSAAESCLYLILPVSSAAAFLPLPDVLRAAARPPRAHTHSKSVHWKFLSSWKRTSVSSASTFFLPGPLSWRRRSVHTLEARRS